MWLLDEALSDSSTSEHLDAIKKLNKKTVIIGNGVTRNSIYAAGKEDAQNAIEWDAVVRKNYKDTFPSSAPRDANGLILATRILQGDNGSNKKKRRLLEAIYEGTKGLEHCVLHELILQLNPDAIITTNYDHLIERSLDGLTDRSWRCFVRDSWRSVVADRDENTINLYKMHGTLPVSTSAGSDKKYRFKEEPGNKNEEERAYDSIVISEHDYDQCNQEIHFDGSDIDSNPMIKDLTNSLLIFGKGIYWEDLSFMKLLRERRRLLRRLGVHEGIKDYWFVHSLSDNDALTLETLEITPVLVPLPNNANDGHYFFALYKVLEFIQGGVCVASGKNVKLNSELQHKLTKALSKPHFVAIGLSAFNTAVALRSDKDQKQPNLLPVPGRKNHGLDPAEEYPGGSALTAISIFSSLASDLHYDKALVSVVGDDLYAKEIFRHCKDFKIDSDAISENEDNEVGHQGQSTWRSTILVHTYKKGAGKAYPGQRIFLDRTFKNGKLNDVALNQFRNMLTENENLKVVYLDKWLACKVTDNDKAQDSRARDGFLSEPENLKFVKQSIIGSDIDVVYEAGGNGSGKEAEGEGSAPQSETPVEDRLSEVTNIFTSGFPFFANYILSDKAKYKKKVRKTKIKEVKAYFKVKGSPDFRDENAAIKGVLRKYFKSKNQNVSEWVDVPPDWLGRANKFVQRKLGATPFPRRWFIATLHNNGCLAMDLNQGKMIHLKREVNQEDVQNTAGAGDTFRGALCFALIYCKSNSIYSEPDSSHKLMRICSNYATELATQRSLDFSMLSTLSSFGKPAGKRLELLNPQSS